jgi:cell division protein FtsI (penicillin-binding protein 3)
VTPPAQPQRILKPSTAITMRHMMEGVVLFGTGRRYANLQGYSSAGKTGSAQIYDFAERHYTHIYNASFMGFAPVANPAIVVVVTVNATHGGSAGYGGPVAGPVFRVVAQEALRVLDVPKDLPDTPIDVAGAKPADANDLAIADLGSTEPNILEEAAQQNEPATQSTTAGAKPAGPAVPNFAGLSKRAVVALAESQGVRVLLVGEGAARTQVPSAGGPLHPGERIRVEFVK